MRKAEAALALIVAVSFAIGCYFYGSLPDRLASHLNASGAADGYMPKFWRLFLMPIISAVIFLFFAIVPRIDPMKSNIMKFRKHYDRFIVLVALFFLYLQVLAIAWNAGAVFSIVQLLVPAFAVLFYYCGVLTENSRRNWFIGIRTPWTMSSDIVWNKTNRVGGRLFKAAGVISLAGMLFNEYAILFVIVPAIFAAIYSFAYSYVEYRKTVRQKAKKQRR